AQRIDCGQTISQPYIVGRMTELLELEPTDRVLEVGTGCGYQTAVLARLAREIYTVEWHEDLSKAAKQRLTRLGARNVHFRVGDGTQGWPGVSDFNAIIVTAGGPMIPETLQNSLALGGRMVIPLGAPEQQHLVRVRRTESGFQAEQLTPCRFVPLRSETDQ
ncbi:MAG: protein-L-isoaspartate(D-aspartate) O-methyltransferase, partial [Phycisphaerae bacterium]